MEQEIQNALHAIVDETKLSNVTQHNTIVMNDEIENSHSKIKKSSDTVQTEIAMTPYTTIYRLNVNNIEKSVCSNTQTQYQNRTKRKAYHMLTTQHNANTTSSSHEDDTTVSQSPFVSPQLRTTTVPRRYRPKKQKHVSRYTCRII
jgi:hypothetical protein